jgi:hypothetical protein
MVSFSQNRNKEKNEDNYAVMIIFYKLLIDEQREEKKDKRKEQNIYVDNNLAEEIRVTHNCPFYPSFIFQ